jgi:CheY-like chemotaxis protein
MILARTGGRPLSILIADGHADGAETLATLLRMYGHDVTVARTGSAALAAAALAPPDVLIVEPYLRGLDGWEVARRLSAGSPRPVCIAVSCGGLPEDCRRSCAAGIDVHLLKPADPAALVALLAGVPRAGGPTALAV